jgi:uncharacterized membrane protein
MARSTTQRNIDTICEIERDALDRRSLWARVGDVIAARAGQMWFIVLHAVWFTVWIWLNAGASRRVAPGHIPFDSFPYPLLNLVVALEAIFLSLFILMSQNRSNLQAEQRNHLDLQINLLAEHENTKILQMLNALCAHHGLVICQDPEIEELAKRTEPREVLEELKNNLPHHESPRA